MSDADRIARKMKAGLDSAAGQDRASRESEVRRNRAALLDRGEALISAILGRMDKLGHPGVEPVEVLVHRKLLGTKYKIKGGWRLGYYPGKSYGDSKSFPFFLFSDGRLKMATTFPLQEWADVSKAGVSESDLDRIVHGLEEFDSRLS